MKVNPLTIANMMRKVERMDRELRQLKEVQLEKRRNRWRDPSTGWNY